MVLHGRCRPTLFTRRFLRSCSAEVAMERVRTTDATAPVSAVSAIRKGQEEDPRLVWRSDRGGGVRPKVLQCIQQCSTTAAAAAHYAVIACAAHNAVGFTVYLVDVVAVAVGPSVYS